MKLNLSLPFVDLVIKEFGFLATHYGFNSKEENPWRVSYQRESIKVVIEFDGRSLGCWIEREDLSRSNKYRALAVKVISESLGYEASKDVLFQTREDMLLGEIKKNSVLMQKYCSGIIKNDFSHWESTIVYLEKTT